MSLEQIAGTLWRRRLSFALAFAFALALVVAVTFTLPKTYTATATLYVGNPAAEDQYVDTRLTEQHTRTYATLAGNPSVAEEVLRASGSTLSRSGLLARMSFAPVERTQLLLISAEGPTPEEAQFLANAYGSTFVERMMRQLDEGRAPAAITMADEAAAPTSPSRPRPALYIGLGTLLALFLALGVALLRERLDTRIRVAAEADTVLEQPIMARIPRMNGGSTSRRSAVDRFAVLRTNLDFVDESQPRVVVVTSPGVSEGKSTVSANLALACARDGERVVLVEADLRRPGLDGTPVAKSADRSRVGLSNYLAGAAPEEAIVRPHPALEGVSIVWSGAIPPNPAALLGSERLDALIASLRLDFDRVIIDTCPISVGADASVIASRVDGVLYVVDQRKTRRSEAVAGLNQLRGVRARILGVVLNRASISTAEGYYYVEKPERKARREAEQVESL